MVQVEADVVCEHALNWIFSTLIDGINAASSLRPFVFGIGSGSTIVPFIQGLAERLQSLSGEKSKDSFICIPTSEQSRHLLTSMGRDSRPFIVGTLDDLNADGLVDVTVDGADYVDVEGKFLIKGGGAAHCQEKIVAEASKYYVIIVANDEKLKKNVDEAACPVEVIPFAANHLLKVFIDQGIMRSGLIRQCPSNSGKIGPIVTDNGNLVLDLKINREEYAFPEKLDQKIRSYAGVVETGLFWRLPRIKSILIYPSEDSSISIVSLSK